MWHYMQSGAFQDSQVGPLPDQQFLQLAFDGKINGATLIHHPQHTSGQWAKLETVSIAMLRFQAGKMAREQATAGQKAAREQKAREDAEERQRQLQMVAESAARQAEREQRERAAAIALATIRCPYCNRSIVASFRKERTSYGWIQIIGSTVLWGICSTFVAFVGSLLVPAHVGFFALVALIEFIGLLVWAIFVAHGYAHRDMNAYCPECDVRLNN